MEYSLGLEINLYMITFLSSPKAFKGIDKDNQYRAIKSWLSSAKDVEVILYGNSIGIDEAGLDLNVKVIKEIESSNSGAPFFGAIVNHASKHGKYDIQTYLNCDILIFNISDTISKIIFNKFLGVGQRIDLSEGVFIDDMVENYSKILNDLHFTNKAILHESTGIDYFIFQRNMWQDLKQITIGRGGYDNALLNFCKQENIPIIDCTFNLIALHQFHNYNHVNGNKNFVFYGDEAKSNLEVAGRYSLLSVSDADYVLENNNLNKNFCRGDIIREVELKIKYKYKLKAISLLIRIIWKFLFFIKIIRPREYKLSEILLKSRQF